MFSVHSIKTVAGTTVAAGALGLVALGLAGTANASRIDDAFLAELEAEGITPPSASVAISDAHAVCDMLDEGYSPDEVITAVADATGLSNDGANTFAVAAADAYCPEYVTTG